MSGIVLLHAAGVRLGADHGRSRERQAAFERLVKVAESESPDALLVAGGLLGASALPREMLGPLERGLGRLAEAGVPVVVAASRRERSGRAPSLLEWLAGRELIRLADEEVELGTRLGIVGLRALNRRKRSGTSRRRLVLLVAAPMEAAGELERFAYVAVGGGPARRKLSRRMHDPGPLLEAAPGHTPIFLRVRLGSGEPRVEEVASGAPSTELLELDVTGLADPGKVVERVAAAAGRLRGKPRRLHVRLAGEPTWPEESVDLRALAGRIAESLGAVEVEAELRTGLRLASGRILPADASLETIEEAVIRDLLEASAPPLAGSKGFASLAAGSLAGLAGSNPAERKRVAERLDHFRRAEVDGAR
jgi:hypothetical protein